LLSRFFASAEIGLEDIPSGRSLAAWIGLVPKQHISGGKDKLGSITKQGNGSSFSPTTTLGRGDTLPRP